MQVVLLEDRSGSRFGPLDLLRPDFDLRCGALTFREKIERRRPDWDVLLCPRSELGELCAEQYPGRGLDGLLGGRALLLYGHVVPDEGLLRAIEGIRGDSLLVTGGLAVGAVLEEASVERVGGSGAADAGLGALGIEASAEVPARAARFPWDLVRLTPDEIAEDAPTMPGYGEEAREKIHSSVRLEGEDGIAVGEGSTIGPGVVLDARRGPVLIGVDVEIMPNAVVVGPAAIGDGSLVRAGAAVYGGTSVGPVCKIGGEIQTSVLESFSNKQHGGFLGHSYVGSWVNLGAATDNSDLKNNYGSVRVEIDGEVIDTGSPSVGAVIGDHSKTAIGTKINTGTVVGIFCNVVTQGLTPKSVADFSWGTVDGFVRHDLERALETARIAMGRRGRTLTPALRRRIEALHRSRARAS
jgi:UDP-N-acetylglucosamine diphosphorylase/glucosamine-1-phosphate N-acetyltransferase